MECQCELSFWSVALCRMWHVPEGFATLVLALATILTGVFVIGTARIAWSSVQAQIRSAEKIEADRGQIEVRSLEAGFTAELLVYSRAILQAASVWNARALSGPSDRPVTDLPVFLDPIFYKANVSRIGLIPESWVPMAIIGFYSNVLEINDQTKEILSGRPTVNATSISFAVRLRLMASSLSQALDGLNADRKFKLAPDVLLQTLISPSGITLDRALNPPQTLQDALLQVAGDPPRNAGAA